MVWGMVKGRSYLPILAVQIQALWLVSEQKLTVPLGSMGRQLYSATHVLHAPASLLHLGCTPGPESQHMQSPLPPKPPHVKAYNGDTNNQASVQG